MKKVIFRNVVIVVSALLGLTGIILGVELAFYSPSALNNFIALKVYEAPANTAFKDQNFYNCVVDTYNEENGTSVAYTQSLTDEQLKTITNLKCVGYNKSDELKIKSVEGIEKLTALRVFWISSNQLTELDVSHNIELRVL